MTKAGGRDRVRLDAPFAEYPWNSGPGASHQSPRPHHLPCAGRGVDPYPIKWEPPPASNLEGLALRPSVFPRSGPGLLPRDSKLVNTLHFPAWRLLSCPLSTVARNLAPHSSWLTQGRPRRGHSPRHGIPTRTPGPRFERPGISDRQPGLQGRLRPGPGGRPGTFHP